MAPSSHKRIVRSGTNRHSPHCHDGDAIGGVADKRLSRAWRTSTLTRGWRYGQWSKIIAVAGRNMNVLFSTHTSPYYMPPLVLAERQILLVPTIPTHGGGGVVRTLNTPMRIISDIGALVSALPAEQQPDITIVLSDAFQNCVPVNLGAVPGHKVLLVADTHHGNVPLRTLLDYARRESPSIASSSHTIRIICIGSWRPILRRPPIFRTLTAPIFRSLYSISVRRPLSLWGRPASGWLRFRYLLEAIRDVGLPLIVREAPAPVAAAMYNATQVSLDCPREWRSQYAGVRGHGGRRFPVDRSP